MIVDKYLELKIKESIINYIHNYQCYERNYLQSSFYTIRNYFVKNEMKKFNYKYIKDLQNIFYLFNKLSSSFENKSINTINNEKGYIKHFLYSENLENGGNSKIFIHGLSNNECLLSVSITGFSTKSEKISDLKNEILKVKPNFKIYNIMEYKNIIFKNESFENYEKDFRLKEERKNFHNEEAKEKDTLYCFVIINKEKEVTEISDFFSFINKKQFYKRKNSIIKYKFLDFIMEKNNDLEYYMNLLFEEFNDKSKIQKLKDYFNFRINFYRLLDGNNKRETKNINLSEIEKEVIKYLSKNNNKLNHHHHHLSSIPHKLSLIDPRNGYLNNILCNNISKGDFKNNNNNENLKSNINSSFNKQEQVFHGTLNALANFYQRKRKLDEEKNNNIDFKKIKINTPIY
ncbi:hypothetical protein BCR36DRAFT_579895 [Piromyces finnis]|uniref:Uncharacterized protein n=1 Tax=Piromyces finnis TaxID=1754191 RepID=A0A1Y1VLG3_9FUNG|nr:hypothetical protein BCR36DRAFT_579895 [Piromyces finnis]|eukprot:ORX59319.1 hypothetical protein BCR36DRAFT_579895 [Piromyces finnis]